MAEHFCDDGCCSLMKAALNAAMNFITQTKSNEEIEKTLKAEINESFKAKITEMEKCVTCLALEVPKEVHIDVEKRWKALRAEIETSRI
jgi:hypothetical protein